MLYLRLVPLLSPLLGAAAGRETIQRESSNSKTEADKSRKRSVILQHDGSVLEDSENVEQREHHLGSEAELANAQNSQKQNAQHVTAQNAYLRKTEDGSKAGGTATAASSASSGASGTSFVGKERRDRQKVQQGKTENKAEREKVSVSGAEADFDMDNSRHCSSATMTGPSTFMTPLRLAPNDPGESAGRTAATKFDSQHWGDLQTGEVDVCKTTISYPTCLRCSDTQTSLNKREKSQESHK